MYGASDVSAFERASHLQQFFKLICPAIKTTRGRCGQNVRGVNAIIERWSSGVAPACAVNTAIHARATLNNSTQKVKFMKSESINAEYDQLFDSLLSDLEEMVATLVEVGDIQGFKILNLKVGLTMALGCRAIAAQSEREGNC
jgi:hypothetical protein